MMYELSNVRNGSEHTNVKYVSSSSIMPGVRMLKRNDCADLLFEYAHKKGVTVNEVLMLSTLIQASVWPWPSILRCCDGPFLSFVRPYADNI